MFNIFKDFQNHFSERIRNPFIFSFIVAWTFRHWELFFTLFNFDSNLSRSEKIAEIKTYLGDTCGLLWIPLFVAFGGIVSFYLLSNISRLIAMASRKWLTPLVDRLVGKNNVLSKDRLEEANKIIKHLKKSYREVEEESASLYTTNEKLMNENMRLEHLRNTSDKTIYEKDQDITLKQQENRELQKEFKKYEPVIIGIDSFQKFWVGKWRKEYKDTNHNFTIKDLHYFQDNRTDPAYRIENITYDPDSKHLSFVLIGMWEKNHFLYNRIREIQDGRWEGTENGIPVTYVRTHNPE